jgi:hypothetical protein
MKYKFLKAIVCILLLAGFKSYSQITNGNWMAGGSASFAYTNNNSEAYLNYKSIMLSLTPKVGYFFIDRFAAGISATISNYKTIYPKDNNNTSSYGGRTTTYNFGPFGRYYLLNTENIYNIFIEGSYQHQIRRDRTLNVSSNQAANNFSISAGPVIYFNSSVGIEFIVGYSSLKLEGFKGRNNSLLTGIGFQIHLEK